MGKSQHTSRYRNLLNLLRERREALGLRQIDVEERLGAYKSFIFKVECGERRIDVVELADLCKVYRLKLPKILKAIGYRG